MVTHAVVCTMPHQELNPKCVAFRPLPWGGPSSESLKHWWGASVTNKKAGPGCSEHLAIPQGWRLPLVLAWKWSWRVPKSITLLRFSPTTEPSPLSPHCQGAKDKGTNLHLRWHLTLIHERILSVRGTKCMEIKYWTAGRTLVQTGLTQEKKSSVLFS